LLIQGQELIARTGQPDVANSILHLTGDTPFIIDTGTTKAFRALTGWSFCDGAVNVVRSQGPLCRAPDGANGPCGAMHDADQLKILTALSHAATLVESGDVEVLTEGHLFRVNRGPEALARAEAFLDQATGLDARVHGSLAGLAEPPEIATFIEAFAEAYASLGTQGGNPGPDVYGHDGGQHSPRTGHGAKPQGRQRRSSRLTWQSDAFAWGSLPPIGVGIHGKPFSGHIIER
jgi:hypothetical protein